MDIRKRKRKGLVGGVVRKRQTKGKSLAEHDRHVKYTQLNSDVFTGTVTVDWA